MDFEIEGKLVFDYYDTQFVEEIIGYDEIVPYVFVDNGMYTIKHTDKNTLWNDDMEKLFE